MTKKNFLKKLNGELKALPAAERKKALDYYSELIDDRVEEGFTEESAVMQLGEAKPVAQGILQDAKERGVKLKRGGKWPVLAAVGILLAGFICGIILYFITSLLNFNADSVANFLQRLFH